MARHRVQVLRAGGNPVLGAVLPLALAGFNLDWGERMAPMDPDTVFLRVTQDEAREALRESLNGGQGLLNMTIAPDSRDEFLRLYSRWTRRNAEQLRAFFTGTRLVGEYESCQMADEYAAGGSPYSDFEAQAAKGYIRARMTVLESILDRLPLFVAIVAGPRDPGAIGSRVFIVHGHDEVNLHRLRDLLHERWGLDPLILRWTPGMGRTLIEKFEEEAQACGFAFVLMTPDDQVRTVGGDYAQARPNAVFELGWFYGRLGRAKVVVLVKKGTQVHTDLEGLCRIDFAESVEEKIVDIERELTAAQMILAHKTGA